MQPPGQSRTTRRLGRSLLWPIRRFFDPRFEGLSAQISEQVGASQRDIVQRTDAARSEILAMRAEVLAVLERNQTAFRQTEKVVLDSVTDLRRRVEADLEANSELATIVGRSLGDLLDEVERLRELLEAMSPQAATPPRG